uniref:SXP/RAL-2 family protein Ani s 5-like cation-binding domain-containing protein n=1 Tax=Setaria digitata TaxID=48799 RepID=A0A915PR50_9BILA
MIAFFGRLALFLSVFLSVFLIFSGSVEAQKRRIIRLLTPWAKKASINGQQAFQAIVDNEMQNIDNIYRNLASWASDQGSNFVKAFNENLKKTEKEAYAKRDELGIEIDQLPPLVADAIQVVDIFRQDPTKSDLEERKMINDLKRTIDPLFVERYQILLDRAQKLHDEYGINLFRSPFTKQRKHYLGSDEL